MATASPVELISDGQPRALQRSNVHATVARVLFLTLLFGAELVAITMALDGSALAHRRGLTAFIRDWGPAILRGILGFIAMFLTFAFVSKRAALHRLCVELGQSHIRWSLFVGHASMLAAFARASSVLYSSRAGLEHADWIAGAWFATGLAAIVCGALALIPATIWIELFRGNIVPCVWALAGVAATSALTNVSRGLWRSASLATLGLSKALLSLVLPGVVANPATMSIGTLRFHVIIAPECSGLEGVTLILAFTTLWLILFRRECRFPHCIALIPAGVAASFLLNSVRIAALILIGNAGAPHIAMGGFHSQAGWIMFNVVGMSFCLAVRNSSWFTRTSREETHPNSENPTGAYLSPFLAILAAGMIAAALASTFQWLYALRFVAAAAALWIYRHEYARMNWKSNWTAPLWGAGIFVVWIAMQRVVNPHASGMPAPLAAAPVVARDTWIGLYILAAVTAVPIAEELAFRGFLLRRLMSSQFETLPFQRVNILAVFGSSAVFGLMHGDRWLAASVAALILAFLAVRRGRLGDAVVAHATANLLLAAYVLFCGNWQLW